MEQSGNQLTDYDTVTFVADHRPNQFIEVASTRLLVYAIQYHFQV